MFYIHVYVYMYSIYIFSLYLTPKSQFDLYIDRIM